MALSAFSVDKANEVLNLVIPGLQPGNLLFDEVDLCRPGWIRFASPKGDGGCESVFTDVEHITPEQLKMFNDLRKGISNSPFEKDMGNGITRIGWF